MRAAALLLALTLTLSRRGLSLWSRPGDPAGVLHRRDPPRRSWPCHHRQITNALGDPYTYYMTAQQFEDFQKNLGDSDVVGIGVMVESTADGLEGHQRGPGFPRLSGRAEDQGDLIVAADGVTVEEAGSTEALATLIRGEVGTRVTITVERDGAGRSSI